MQHIDILSLCFISVSCGYFYLDTFLRCGTFIHVHGCESIVVEGGKIYISMNNPFLVVTDLLLSGHKRIVKFDRDFGLLRNLK